MHLGAVIRSLALGIALGVLVTAVYAGCKGLRRASRRR
jgi:hypothetical protein